MMTRIAAACLALYLVHNGSNDRSPAPATAMPAPAAAPAPSGMAEAARQAVAFCVDRPALCEQLARGAAASALPVARSAPTALEPPLEVHPLPPRRRLGA